MKNIALNLSGLIGNAYDSMEELNNDIILAFETEEEVIVYNANNNVIKAYVNSPEATEYNIVTEEINGFTVVVDVEEFI